LNLYRVHATVNYHVHEKSKNKLGRPKLFEEQLRIPLPLGTIARIDAVLADGEPRLDMLREAIEREIKRRQRTKPPSADP
jgi:hypothetical protein